jgi:hypothetical protein
MAAPSLKRVLVRWAGAPGGEEFPAVKCTDY